MDSYSPLLAAATAAFELIAAGMAFLGPGRKRITYPTGLIFLLLAGYQIAEISVCARPGNLLFTRAAFFDITWLPPVGLLLTYQLTAPKLSWLKYMTGIYLTAALGLSVWIFVDPNCITQSVCQVVIARYFNSSPFDIVYGLFYQSGLALLVISATAGLRRAVDETQRKHLGNLLVGALGFIIPSTALRFLLPEPSGLLPSVMCHFAVFLAISLFFLILREQRMMKKDAPASSRSG